MTNIMLLNKVVNKILSKKTRFYYLYYKVLNKF